MKKPSAKNAAANKPSCPVCLGGEPDVIDDFEACCPAHREEAELDSALIVARNAVRFLLLAKSEANSSNRRREAMWEARSEASWLSNRTKVLKASRPSAQRGRELFSEARIYAKDGRTGNPEAFRQEIAAEISAPIPFRSTCRICDEDYVGLRAGKCYECELNEIEEVQKACADLGIKAPDWKDPAAIMEAWAAQRSDLLDQLDQARRAHPPVTVERRNEAVAMHAAEQAANAAGNDTRHLGGGA